jgi:prolyl-tRNA editing enzyme YbaK/EbsC (Cys-tRNA(Pro) deacylase)
MHVIPADQKIANDKVKTTLDAKDIRFVTENEVAEITKGVRPGVVPRLELFSN